VTRKRFHLNVVGPFYVEDGMCITCGAPEHEAPTLMGSVEEPEHHCYFKRQPETPEEVEQAIRAVRVSCCQAVRYGGDDAEIRARIDAPWPAPAPDEWPAPARGPGDLSGVAWAAIAVALTFLASPVVRANAAFVAVLLLVVVAATSHLLRARRRPRD
jgi:hypothetical protein